MQQLEWIQPLKKSATLLTFSKLGPANFTKHPSVIILDLMNAVVIVPHAPTVSKREP